MPSYKTGPLPAVAKTLSAACESVRPGEATDAAGGVIPSFVASPASTAEASALLRAAAGHDLAVVPRGSGSRLGWGTPPSRCDLVVGMLGMGQVIEHASGDLVARVQAGARMGDVAAVLAAAGQEIALDVPATATVGGVVADALAGPRRLRYGSPRDLLIGITIVRADGTVAHSGGKVVKNVAGYDLGKLFAGSAGTLGLITEATFRLHPLPADRAWVTAQFPSTGVMRKTGRAGSFDDRAAAAAIAAEAAAAVAAAASSPLVPSAVELQRPKHDGPVYVSVLLEGSADGVAARARRMADVLAGADSSPNAASREISRVAPDWWGGVPDPGDGTLLRASFWVSALGRVLDAIDDGARRTGVRPVVRGSAGAGLLYLTVPRRSPADSAGPGDVAQFASIVRGAMPAGRGGVTMVTGGAAARSAIGADNVPGLDLMRAVKAQFDPGGRMAPGRFPEGAS